MSKMEKKIKTPVLWAWEFTKRLITIITILYIIFSVVEILLILFAIIQTGSFSYLDTFISENSQTFRDVVCANLLKTGVENVFKYNDFGGRVPTKNSDDVFNDEQHTAAPMSNPNLDLSSFNDKNYEDQSGE